MRPFYRLVALLCLSLAPCWAATHLEVEGSETIHISHVKGVVVDGEKKPLANAEVTLARGEKDVFTTRTDASGRFNLDHAGGKYLLRVKAENYSPATRQIMVGETAMAVLHKNTLYVILGPGACAEECSSVFTSKREFDRTVRRMSGHNN